MQTPGCVIYRDLSICGVWYPQDGSAEGLEPLPVDSRGWPHMDFPNCVWRNGPHVYSEAVPQGNLTEKPQLGRSLLRSPFQKCSFTSTKRSLEYFSKKYTDWFINICDFRIRHDGISFNIWTYKRTRTMRCKVLYTFRVHLIVQRSLCSGISKNRNAQQKSKSDSVKPSPIFLTVVCQESDRQNSISTGPQLSSSWLSLTSMIMRIKQNAYHLWKPGAYLYSMRNQGILIWCTHFAVAESLRSLG